MNEEELQPESTDSQIQAMANSIGSTQREWKMLELGQVVFRVSAIGSASAALFAVLWGEMQDWNGDHILSAFVGGVISACFWWILADALKLLLTLNVRSNLRR